MAHEQWNEAEIRATAHQHPNHTNPDVCHLLAKDMADVWEMHLQRMLIFIHASPAFPKTSQSSAAPQPLSSAPSPGSMYRGQVDVLSRSRGMSPMGVPYERE